MGARELAHRVPAHTRLQGPPTGGHLTRTERLTMKCPVCPDATLLMTDRQGVEIDYCPSCRGVWLDRGELDKLLQLGAQHDTTQSRSAAAAIPRGRPDFEDSDFRK